MKAEFPLGNSASFYRPPVRFSNGHSDMQLSSLFPKPHWLTTSHLGRLGCQSAGVVNRTVIQCTNSENPCTINPAVHSSGNQSKWDLTTPGAHPFKLRDHSNTGWFVIGSRQCSQSRRRMSLDSVSILHVRAHRCG